MKLHKYSKNYEELYLSEFNKIILIIDDFCIDYCIYVLKTNILKCTK